MIQDYFLTFYNHHSEAYLLLSGEDFHVLNFNKESSHLFELAKDEKLKDQGIFDFEGFGFKYLSDLELDRLKIEIKSKGRYNTVLGCKSFQGKEFIGQLEFSRFSYQDVEYFLLRIIDISDQTNSISQITQKDDSFRSVIDQLPNAVVIHDFGEVLYANPYFLKILRKPLEEIIGVNFQDLVHSSYKPVIQERIELLKQGITPEIEHVKFEVGGKLIAFSIQSVLDNFRGSTKIVVILTNLEVHQNLAKESIRANLAVEANIHLEKEIERHKQTQLRLIKAEELTRCMISSSIDMIISSDQQDHITHISPSACFIFGFKETEMIGASPKLLYEEESEYQRVRAKIIRDGFFIGEVENRRSNGEIFTSYLSASPIKNEDGEVLGFMGVSRDITELKKAETELIQSEKRYRELFENLTDAIIVVDEFNDITEMNEAAANLFEVDYHSNHIFNLYDFIDADSAIIARKESKILVESGVVKGLQLSITTGKGNHKVVELSSKAIYVEGAFKGSRDILRDITQKLKDDALIKEQTSKLESIFENSSNVMICTLDKSGLITSINSKYKEIFSAYFNTKLKIGDNIMKRYSYFIDPVQHKKLKQSFQKARLGTYQHIEFSALSKGDEIWFESFISPIIIEGLNEFDLVCLSIDITGKKKSEREILNSLKEKEVLLKEVHHRVKNNLQVISSILNLQSSYVRDENTLNILRESQNRIKSMSFIHESLYRTENFSSVDFSQYIENLTRNLVQSYIIQHGHIQLNLSLGSHDLSLDQAIPCGLIINELISNAIKYAFPDGGSGTISINLRKENDSLYFEVKDDGVGLPKDFDIEKTDTLGLQLVTTLISQLDGEIEVINDGGTKYLFNFIKLD